MKKTSSLILLTAILLSPACKKEDGNTAPIIHEQSFTVAENTPEGSLVGKVVATDANNDPLSYTIVLGNIEYAFAIDTTSGDLTISNPDAIDFERYEEFQLTVEVSDGELISENKVIVSITDIEMELGDYNPRTFTRDNNTLLYQILLPYNYHEATALPLLVFLHGAGERGSNNTAQLTHGSKLFIDSILTYPTLVVFPQCPTNEYWSNSFDGPLHPAQPAMTLVELLVDSLINDNKVDPSRVYVAGLSMGGFGSAQLLAKFPDMFAAGVVICGGAPLTYADELKKTPTWIFHGQDDSIVPTLNSIQYFQAIDEGDGKHRLTLYPGVDHESWNHAFREPDFLSWIFSKSLE